MTAKPDLSKIDRRFGGTGNRPGDRMMAALRMPGLTPNESRVLAVIAWHDGPGGAELSAELIGLEAGGMAESTARKHIAGLARKKALNVQKRQRASRYTPNYAAAGQAPKIERPPEPDAPQFEFSDLPESGKSQADCDRSESERSKDGPKYPDRSESAGSDRSESASSDRSESAVQTARIPSGKPEVTGKENRKDEPGPPVVPPSAEPPAPKGEGGDIAAAFSAWNELARSIGLAEATMPSAAYPQPDRVAAMEARLAECGGLDGWQAALDRVAASRLIGDMGSGWRISLDWLLKPDRFRQVIEGAWERRPVKKRNSSVENALEMLKKQGFT